MEDKWRFYTTKNGDTWDKVSHKLFKDSKLIHHLYFWNEEYTHFFIFPSGIKLKYKLIKKNNTNLPPWRQ